MPQQRQVSHDEPILLPPQLSRHQGICQTKPYLNFTVNKFDIKGEKILVILEHSSSLVFTKKSKEQRLTEVPESPGRRRLLCLFLPAKAKSARPRVSCWAPTQCPLPRLWKWFCAEAPQEVHSYGSTLLRGCAGGSVPRHRPRDTLPW